MDLLYSYIQLPSVGTEKRKKKEKTGNSNRREETVIKKDKSRNVKNGKRIDHISLTFHSRLHLFAFPHLRVFFFVLLRLNFPAINRWKPDAENAIETIATWAK